MVTLGLRQAPTPRPAPVAARWLGVLACAAAASGVASAEAPAQPETFRWNGELVALDDGKRELTIRAPLSSPAALADMPDLTAGDSILVNWAGLGDRAHGIRAVTPDDGAELEGDAGRFVVRARFKALDPATRYLTFRAAISKKSAALARTMRPGDWATLTSPHAPISAAATATVARYAAAPAPIRAAAGAFRWHGELVGLDEGAGKLTVRARVTSPAALAAVADAKSGAPIVITWSGFEDRAAGIRGVALADGSGLWGNNGFLLRARLVSADADAGRLTFETTAADESIAAVRTLTRGDWATVTSPHWPTDGAAITTVAAYDATRPGLRADAEGDYRWHGELVALDSGARALTVRARVASPAGLDAVADTEAGAPIVITWSGFGDRAGAIRSVTPDDGSGLWGNDGFLLRGALVSADAARGQLTFRTTIPAESAAAVRTLTRGDWTTVTSPHWPAAGAAVTSVAAYDATRPALRAKAKGDYRWHGELLALDEDARTFTVRARVAARNGLAAVAGARAGDAIVITWSGFEDRAGAIRAVTAEDGSGLWGNDGFLLRARFVGADPTGQRLTFRAALPDPSVAALRTLRRGDWATVTSPHWPTGGDAVAGVVAYDAGRADKRAAAKGTYRWHGEFVALDETARTLTVQARVADRNGLAAVTGAQAGDPIVITWSGFDDRANDIRAVVPADGSGLWGNDGFLLRAEFVSADAASGRITFQTAIPEESVAAVRFLTPGEWTTVTSPHWPTAGAGAVVSADAYDASRRARRYVWPGEVVALDASGSAATVSAPAESHIFRYAERFAEGDAVVLVWTPGEDDAVTAVRYVEHRGDSAVLDTGYVLPVEFVAADAERERITFRTKLPAELDAQAALQPGDAIRVTALFEQKGESAAILAVEE